MPRDFTTPLTVEEMYGDWGIEWEDVVDMVDVSLHPRPRTSLYDTFATLGVGEGGYVLDIGGRDAAQALDLAERFRCRVMSVDPVQLNFDEATKAIAEHEHGHLVENKLGSINDIPAADASFDAIFSRDMINHVEDLSGALAECRRVLRPGGAMVIHDVYATGLLEPKETARLCADLAVVPAGLQVDHVEQAVESAGFTIELTDHVGSEWLESLLEKEDGEKRLLRAARLNRNRDAFVDKMGVIPYRVVLANDLWTIYRMIGKLEDRVYVIRS